MLHTTVLSGTDALSASWSCESKTWLRHRLLDEAYFRNLLFCGLNLVSASVTHSGCGQIHERVFFARLAPIAASRKDHQTIDNLLCKQALAAVVEFAPFWLHPMTALPACLICELCVQLPDGIEVPDHLQLLRVIEEIHHRPGRV